jgi:hypothetical protein
MRLVIHRRILQMSIAGKRKKEMMGNCIHLFLTKIKSVDGSARRKVAVPQVASKIISQLPAIKPDDILDSREPSSKRSGPCGAPHAI